MPIIGRFIWLSVSPQALSSERWGARSQPDFMISDFIL